MRVSDESPGGKTVIGSDGRVVGEVAALFLSREALGVESIQVKLRGETADRLCVSQSMFHAGTLEIPVGLVHFIGEAAVVLSVGVDDLRQLLPGGRPELRTDSPL